MHVATLEQRASKIERRRVTAIASCIFVINVWATAVPTAAWLTVSADALQDCSAIPALLAVDAIGIGAK